MYNNSRYLLEISTQHSSDRISETGRFATNVYINFFITFGLENSLLRQRPPFLKHSIPIIDYLVNNLEKRSKQYEEVFEKFGFLESFHFLDV
jgi:hypothetical protein